MTVLKNLHQELSRFRLRLVAAALFVLFCFGLLVARLLFLQVAQHDTLLERAESNRISVVPIVPNRGLIVDRNGVVLASNYSAYTLEITPSKVADLEETIDQLAGVIDIQPRDRRRFKRLMEESKNFESLPIRTKLTDTEVAKFAAQRFRFPGVDIKARLFRSYPMGEVGSHMLGYIGRINQAEKKAMDDWPEEDVSNYRGTEYIGKLGLEQAYERELHGQTGFEEMETSAGGRAIRRLRNRPPTPGNTLHLSIDIKLQALVEKLYGDRRGALVAIDPRNGEVLAFVSKPSFDPNLFVDGIDADSWRDLNENIDKPLLNRALRGTYPPGSTFKPYMAMAALNTGKRSPSLVIQDNLTYSFGGRTFGSAEGDRAGPKDMRLAIVTSSNVYFYSLANEMGVDMIHDQLEPFGFGRKTEIDLLGEVTGDLPSTEWKKKKFRRPEQQKWFAGETISLGIGQGYNNFTMLQLATAMSTLSTGGQRYRPRLVREIEDVVRHTEHRTASDALEPLALRRNDVEVIRNAMHDVTLEGTSRAVFAGAPYASGGKTGTAQAIGLRAGQTYSSIKADERKRDHSLYIAFAPYDSPRIALALIVENAGFGSTSAAPIARRVFDYVLEGLYPSEEDIAKTQLGQTTAPIGTPRRAVDVPLPGQMNVPGVAASAASAASSASSAGPNAGPEPAASGAPAASAASSVPAANAVTQPARPASSSLRSAPAPTRPTATPALPPSAQRGASRPTPGASP
ncbi:penicillin-binding protein 2 [Roseateles depolymerans]|uniref:Peptidoglycan D,D-transpeptidase MrdA n=1 Tax=Roseateles depolymerans TaxID=76731 RepID=A0A0U3MK85_9BURK|nr:penicillin-binding protein 2 [Roseateles depolymerans]ALV09149.1 penicillin-binding protein 2 [Roseateles depolymerans]REG13904.1 peptidoglycan glycosyltransferase /cell elongation-specific peptidoglycan D,D-transpeptidase [Roseateles depolymerans]